MNTAPPVLSVNVRPVTVPFPPHHPVGRGGRGRGVLPPGSDSGVPEGYPLGSTPNSTVNRGLFRDGRTGVNSLSAVLPQFMNLPWGNR